MRLIYASPRGDVPPRTRLLFASGPESLTRNSLATADMLLVFDEVQTGFGRTGKMWAAEYYGVTPDILVFGKGVGGGFPLAGILASAALDGFQPGDEALTFGEFPISLAAGLAALEVLKRDRLIEACAEMGKYATDALKAMKPRHRLIGDIRGPGLLIGIELVRDQATREPATTETLEVYRRAIDQGVIFGTTKYAGLGNVLKVKPPFTITRAQMDRVLTVLDEVLTFVENDVWHYRVQSPSLRENQSVQDPLLVDTPGV